MKKFNFGFRVHGFHTQITLRLKLTRDNFNKLSTKYGSDLKITWTHKGYTMIEGSLRNEIIPAFHDYMALLKADNEIDLALIKRQGIQNRINGIYEHNTVDPDDIDAPW